MLPATVLFAALSYALMLLAYLHPRPRIFHIPAMIAVILFDIGMPIYLYTHRNWWHRLVEQGDILSFLVWMHFGLLLGMYALETMQIVTATKIWKGDIDTKKTAQQSHHAQGQVLLIVRGFVILTGAILAE